MNKNNKHTYLVWQYLIIQKNCSMWITAKLLIELRTKGQIISEFQDFGILNFPKYQQKK